MVFNFSKILQAGKVTMEEKTSCKEGSFGTLVSCDFLFV